MRNILEMIAERRDDPPESAAAIKHRAEALGIQVPLSYAVFVAEGGLNRVGQGCRVLSPEEISAMRRHVRPGFLPFAGSAEVGLFCWVVDGRDEPPVILFEPGADRCLTVATHFTDWLRQSGY